MSTKTQDTDWADKIGKPSYESIVEMVKRLEHCGECNGEDCQLTAQEIFAGINTYAPKRRKATEEEIKEYHDEEAARQDIDEDPLSLEVRSGWHSPGGEVEEEEFCLLLGTGGPAVRIVGDLDRGEPSGARLEVQDWFKPWTEYIPAEQDVLLTYCRCFYFGD